MRLFLLIILTGISCSIFASMGLDWVQTNSSTGWVRSEAIKVDTAGNVYVTGNFTETIDLDPGASIESYTSEGYKNIFIQKLNSEGDLVWANVLNSSGRGRAIEFDSQGNVLITGAFSGTMDFDAREGVHEVTSIGDGDTFILKLDADGELIWVKNFGGTEFSEHVHFVVDKNDGGIYLTGSFNGTVDFDPGEGEYNLTSAGFSDIFILKLDSSGDFQWAFSAGGTKLDSGMDIGLDSSGNVYTVATFREAVVDFEPGAGVTNLSSSNVNTAILKLNEDGDFEWVKHFSNGYNSGKYITFDSEDNIYVPGLFTSTVGFGVIEDDDGYRVSAGAADAFITKINQDGQTLWTKTFGGIEGDGAAALALTPDEYVIVVGEFDSTVDLDPGEGVASFTATGDESDLYISRFDKDGNFLSVSHLQGSISSTFLDIETSVLGYVYITSDFDATTDFDPSEEELLKTTEGSSEGFVLKLSDGLDRIPDEFSFVDVDDADLDIQVESNVITVAGLEAASTITVTGGEYSINGSLYISDSGLIKEGDSLRLRVVSSNEYDSSAEAIVTVGGVSKTFQVTTKSMAVEENHAPEIKMIIKQNGKIKESEFSNAGAIHVTVLIEDEDENDTYSLKWFFEGRHMTEFDDVEELVVQSSNLLPGTYLVELEVTDEGTPEHIIREKREIKVIKEVPAPREGNMGFYLIFFILVIHTLKRHGLLSGRVQKIF